MSAHSDMDLIKNKLAEDLGVMLGGLPLEDKTRGMWDTDTRYEIVKLFYTNVGNYFIVDHRDGYVLGKDQIDADDLKGEYAYGHSAPSGMFIYLTGGFDTWTEANAFIKDHLLDTMMRNEQIEEEASPTKREERMFNDYLESQIQADIDQRYS